MTSLQLLCAYETSSDSDDEKDSVPCKKPKLQQANANQRTDKHFVQCMEPEATKRKPLSLPAAVISMFSDNEQHVDSCEMHGGRKRTFAHERGSWATFVFAPYPVDHLGAVKSVVSQAIQNSSLKWNICEDFHISLSRTVSLPHHCIEALFEDLKTNSKNFEPFVVEIIPAIEFYTNDEKTRSFLSVLIDETSSNLFKKLVEIVNASFKCFRLQQYYKNPSFHVSFAWIGGDVSESPQLERDVEIFRKYFVDAFSENIFPFHFLMDKVYAKSGHKLMSFKFS